MAERSTSDLSPLAIVCAGGMIPYAVADSLKAQGRPFVLFAIKGIADAARVQEYAHHWIGIGQLGHFRRLARAEGCRRMVFIGSLRRPSIWQLGLDFAALTHLPRIIAAFRGGDDHLLRGIGRIFEAEGFTVIGAHEVAPQVLMPEGIHTRRQPSPQERGDIACALQVLHERGALDVGQAAVALNGKVVALEGPEGTDRMLTSLEHGKVRGGILVKAPKTSQDRRYDLPAVGPDTVTAVVRCGLAGIAVVAGESVVADLDEMVSVADRANVFIAGVEGLP